MKILAINPLVPVVLKVHCDNGSIVDRVVFLDNENEIAYETNEELSVIDGELKQNIFNNPSVDFYVNSYFQNKHNVRWNMIWSLTILGHWLHNNDIHHD